MGTRVIDFGATRWKVWVNTQEQVPEYVTEAKAIARAQQEARTHEHVQVTRSTGGRRPRVVASWVNGVRQ